MMVINAMSYSAVYILDCHPNSSFLVHSYALQSVFHSNTILILLRHEPDSTYGLSVIYHCTWDKDKDPKHNPEDLSWLFLSLQSI